MPLLSTNLTDRQGFLAQRHLSSPFNIIKTERAVTVEYIDASGSAKRDTKRYLFGVPVSVEHIPHVGSHVLVPGRNGNGLSVARVLESFAAHQAPQLKFSEFIAGVINFGQSSRDLMAREREAMNYVKDLDRKRKEKVAAKARAVAERASITKTLADVRRIKRDESVSITARIGEIDELLARSRAASSSEEFSEIMNEVTRKASQNNDASRQNQLRDSTIERLLRDLSAL
ncbi:hypothetical protein [Glutamicibacter arilaitensis]|uniref:hypothetical protein n=1 Tax=Glutamicibacter arilaitensis TaxID=256701 RepID=UPI003F8DDF50